MTTLKAHHWSPMDKSRTTGRLKRVSVCAQSVSAFELSNNRHGPSAIQTNQVCWPKHLAKHNTSRIFRIIKYSKTKLPICIFLPTAR